MYEGEDIEDEETLIDEDEFHRQMDAYKAERDMIDCEPHQRPDYLERMAEQADMRRKEQRENG